MLPHTPAHDLEAADEEKRRERLRTVVHFATSAAFHLGLVLIAVFIVFPPSLKDQLPPAEGTVTFRPHRDPPIQPARDPAEQRDENLERRQRTTVPLHTKRPPDFPVIGTARPQLLIDVTGPEGPLKIGPDTEDTGKKLIIRVPRTARKIVFLIDMSGSMFDTFDYLRAHLVRIVRGLEPFQKFDLIFFSDRTEVWQGRLAGASDNRKRAASAFIRGIVPEAQTKPEKAVRKGLAYDPELLIILSDGEFDTKIVDLVAKLNKNRSTQIDTYSYEHGPAPNLRRLAEENKGTYRVITTEDLRRPPAPTPRRGYAPMPARVYPAAYVAGD